jgi:hypothetical protein
MLSEFSKEQKSATSIWVVHSSSDTKVGLSALQVFNDQVFRSRLKRRMLIAQDSLVVTLQNPFSCTVELPPFLFAFAV